MLSQSIYAAEASQQMAPIDWSIFGPMLINACITICGLAYMFGGVNNRIKVVESDIEKVAMDFRQLRDSNALTNDRIQAIAIMLSKIEARFDMFLIAAGDKSSCPLMRDASAAAAQQKERRTAP